MGKSKEIDHLRALLLPVSKTAKLNHKTRHQNHPANKPQGQPAMSEALSPTPCRLVLAVAMNILNKTCIRLV
ncbi:hypothetical protein [Endozoicomonas sp. 4G]|uniref:hypothetical protein n=1 Tax=Endozoicomonas sp. 4G TaxID=2872754 RepID=UPI002078B87F|nr:hypothetical protein [Endozoicomonas sp. 4G]